MTPLQIAAMIDDAAACELLLGERWSRSRRVVDARRRFLPVSREGCAEASGTLGQYLRAQRLPLNVGRLCSRSHQRFDHTANSATSDYIPQRRGNWF